MTHTLVQVRQGEPGAGVRSLAADEDPGALEQVDQAGQLGDPGASRSEPSRCRAGHAQTWSGRWRIARRTGSVMDQLTENLYRLDAWWTDTPLGTTRVSHCEQLALTLAV